MSNYAHIFTKDFRKGLPQRVLDFFALHKVDLVFKTDSQLLADDKTTRIPKFEKLKKNLGTLCNTPITEDQIDAANNADVCYVYENKNKKKKKNWEQRQIFVVDPVTNIKYVNRIGPGYLDDNISHALTNNDFDCVILVSNDNNNSDPKYEKAVGFLISEFGECKDNDKIFWGIPSLNLICAPKKHHCNSGLPICQNGCGAIGRILMFLYLYSLKQKKIRYGVLELANSYCNVGGLCLYSKFGFREDISIKTEQDLKKGKRGCFGDPDNVNLPMVCDLQNITETDLEEALINNKNIDVPGSDEPLCNKPILKTSEQQTVVDRRLENFNNILLLQRGDVSIDDIKDDHFKTGVVPVLNRDAVKALSKSSRDGNLVFKKFRKKTIRTKKRQRTPSPPSSQPSPPTKRVTRSTTVRKGGWRSRTPSKNRLHRRKWGHG
jgi:hypothetical protein